MIIFLFMIFHLEVRRQKQYFVKYKGLAHVHNCWVPESELLSEGPLLVAEFNRKNEVHFSI